MTNRKMTRREFGGKVITVSAAAAAAVIAVAMPASAIDMKVGYPTTADPQHDLAAAYGTDNSGVALRLSGSSANNPVPSAVADASGAHGRLSGVPVEAVSACIKTRDDARGIAKLTQQQGRRGCEHEIGTAALR